MTTLYIYIFFFFLFNLFVAFYDFKTHYMGELNISHLGDFFMVNISWCYTCACSVCIYFHSGINIQHQTKWLIYAREHGVFLYLFINNNNDNSNEILSDNIEENKCL